ncbi:MAG: YciI family protein [Imperialibacter sp.]|uniref:YciI family protein n=1 Tax=Imperialibacter sp. TaxID=2038411 RepID=UPI0032EBB820
MEKLKDFMLLFRLEPNLNYQSTDNEVAQQKKLWSTWVGGIAAEAKLVSTHQLGFTGKQLSADFTLKDGINITANQILGGNMVVKAASIEDAVGMAKGCPILAIGGNVEVRDILPM